MANFLRRLELNGFKSFAQKTMLEFPSGITAIVGPNGSGKSNVVDAIRWLLGERETKNLRGGKVEDLIFAGNPARPRQGLAQASLHFENRDGFFPTDFAEVSVMREVTRDGSSRYFLNKSEIRLRDLVDFFAKARLGTKGLTIISQGNSDLFIRATPLERREMIEEMLGLREYQIKKSQSENRLKNTQSNLEKVKALIEEILPHLRSLRRQTGRWEKRGAIETELTELENSFFGSQWKNIHRDLNSIDKEIESHRHELEELKKEKIKAEAHQSQIESQEPQEREELKKIKEETRDLLEKRSHIQKELGRLEAQLEIESREKPVASPAVTDALGVLRRARTELSQALSVGGEGLLVAVKKIIKEIDFVLEDRGSSSDKKLVSRELQSRLLSINEDLKKIEKGIKDLAEKEKHLEKSQESFHRSFKEAMHSLENVKSRIEHWENQNQKRLFGKERLNLRLGELSRQITQAGRFPKDFDKIDDQRIEPHHLSELERKIYKLRGDLASIGEVDEAVLKEARETEVRYQFLEQQLVDTEKARDDLKQLISELNSKIKVEFNEALVKINKEFSNFFKTMFDGGHAKLKLSHKKAHLQAEAGEEGTAEINPEPSESKSEDEGGIEIDLSLPKKRLTSLDVLSGGERSLVGIAALFAMISVSPPPFLVLDEIDAALDERNTRRFAQILKEFCKKTQFIVVTHNRATMEAADILYGVTLAPDGTSKILSLKLEGVK